MAGTKFSRRNLNRFKMTYPYIRRRPRYEWVSDKEVTIEVGELVFTDASTGTYAFEESFASAPIITSISYDSESNDIADVNVFVSSVSVINVTFQTSQAFTGKIYFHAMLVAS